MKKLKISKRTVINRIPFTYRGKGQAFNGMENRAGGFSRRRNPPTFLSFIPIVIPLLLPLRDLIPIPKQGRGNPTSRCRTESRFQWDECIVPLYLAFPHKWGKDWPCMLVPSPQPQPSRPSVGESLERGGNLQPLVILEARRPKYFWPSAKMYKASSGIQSPPKRWQNLEAAAEILLPLRQNVHNPKLVTKPSLQN